MTALLLEPKQVPGAEAVGDIASGSRLSCGMHTGRARPPTGEMPPQIALARHQEAMLALKAEAFSGQVRLGSIEYEPPYSEVFYFHHNFDPRRKSQLFLQLAPINWQHPLFHEQQLIDRISPNSSLVL